MELFARDSEALAQVLRQGRRNPSRSFEALLLTHPISINCRLVFEVERDCTEDLGESQSLEFSKDRFRGEAFVEALDDGIERYASASHVVASVALFDVFFRHWVNYSGISRQFAQSFPMPGPLARGANVGRSEDGGD